MSYFWRIEYLCPHCNTWFIVDETRDVAKRKKRIKQMKKCSDCGGVFRAPPEMHVETMFEYTCIYCKEQQQESAATAPAKKICRWCLKRKE
jgi:predicted Zn finger-like uncharacterized protein